MKVKSEREVVQSCPTFSDPMDHTVHGILQARILEWVVVPKLILKLQDIYMEFRKMVTITLYTRQQKRH